MKVHATTPSFSYGSQNAIRSFCPACQDLMISAAKSQHVKDDVVRHWWACESCGHEFRTTVRLSELSAPASQPLQTA
jgi:DNA-directed RNA polymerase subunit M/transcription elongation factor TFIIS